MKTEKEYIKELKAAAKAYYNDEPLMSDEEFDNLLEEFQSLYPKSKYLKEIGAAPNANFPVVKHKIQMGSLLKVKLPEEVSFWIEKYAGTKGFVWSEKVDGLSCYFYFQDGVFTQAIKRGDGIEGEDITENVARIDFPKKLKKKVSGHFRGELFLTKKSFEKHFSDKKNARNAAGGLISRIDGQGCEHLSVMFYFVEGDFKEEIERFEYISDLGLPTPKYGLVNSLSEISKIWEKYEQGLRDKTGYEIDGLCLYANDVTVQKELGSVNNRPRYARAYKFSSQSAVTKLREVILQVSRTGRINPVGKVDPVDVAGAQITFVSLHNFEEIKRLGLKLNQVVHIERKGDVIPQITKGVGPGQTIQEPTKCPCCQSKVKREEIFIYCTNPQCPEKVIQSLVYWTQTLDLKGLGDKMIKKLYEANKLVAIKDFYLLKEKDLSELERSGEKIAKKIINEIHSKKSLDPETLLKGLGIEELGMTTSKLILDHHSFDKIFDLTAEDLINISGIGEITAKKVVSGLSEFKDQIMDLLNHVELKAKVEGKLSGQSFCFTGFRDSTLEQKIKALGGVISSGVNKNLTYLIVKDLDDSSSKIEKAKKNNIKIIKLDDVDQILK